MKKLFTLVMLGIMTVLNVQAAEEVLWTGDWWFSWEAANTDEAHKGWNANSSGVNFADYNEGDVFYFYLVKDSEHLFDNEYYNYRFDDSNWNVLPGCAVTDASGNETKAKFVLTADIKKALASADFALHGHGLKLVKVTKGEEEETLWEGDYNVDWGLPDGDPNREWGGEGQNVTANFVTGAKIFVYLTVAGTDYHKCQFDNWDWEALPGISPALFSEDTKVTIEVTDDIAAAVAEKGFRLHGQGFHVTKVSKAKDVTGIKTVYGTITPAGWASFSSSYPLDLNTISGGEAYYASAANGETVTLTPTTATVPAGEGLMIKGTPNATFTIDVAASGTSISGNLLKGQTTTGNVAASTASGPGTYHYVFGYKKPAEEVTEYGFYNLAAATTVPAGKAYLEITSNGARALRISLGGITEVENIEAEPEAKAQEGKFIENGKLVIIKNGVKYNAAGAKLY